MNTPNPAPETDTRKWKVPALGGEVGPKNACWTFCTTLDVRDRLEVGQSADCKFHSGAGTTVDHITRTA